MAHATHRSQVSPFRGPSLSSPLHSVITAPPPPPPSLPPSLPLSLPSSPSLSLSVVTAPRRVSLGRYSAAPRMGRAAWGFREVKEHSPNQMRSDAAGHCGSLQLIAAHCGLLRVICRTSADGPPAASLARFTLDGCVCVCVCARARAHVRVYMCVYVCVCSRARVYMCVRACVHAALDPPA